MPGFPAPPHPEAGEFPARRPPLPDMSLRNALRRRVLSGPSSASDGDQRTPRSRLARRLSGIERFLWVVVVLGMTADVVLTHAGRQVGLVELNPLARDALHAWGVFGLVALKVVALGVGASLRPLLPDRYTAVIPFGLALPTVPAVISNAAVISITVA